MYPVIKAIFLLLALATLNSCGGKDSPSNSPEYSLSNQMNITDVDYKVLLSESKPCASMCAKGRSIEIIHSSEDLLQQLPDQQDLILSVDFDQQIAVLVKSDQRSSDDIQIMLEGIKHSEKGNDEYESRATLNYIQLGNTCHSDQIINVYYLLFALHKQHKELFFTEHFNYQNCETTP